MENVSRRKFSHEGFFPRKILPWRISLSGYPSLPLRNKSSDSFNFSENFPRTISKETSLDVQLNQLSERKINFVEEFRKIFPCKMFPCYFIPGNFPVHEKFFSWKIPLQKCVCILPNNKFYM